MWIENVANELNFMQTILSRDFVWNYSQLRERGHDMSIGVMARYNNGIVLGADKRTTYLNADGSVCKYEDDYNKIVQIPNRNIYILATGRSHFNGRTLSDIISSISEEDAKSFVAIKKYITNTILPYMSANDMFDGIIVGKETDVESLKFEHFYFTAISTSDCPYHYRDMPCDNKRVNIPMFVPCWAVVLSLHMEDEIYNSSDEAKQFLKQALFGISTLDKINADEPSSIGDTFDIVNIAADGSSTWEQYTSSIL